MALIEEVFDLNCEYDMNTPDEDNLSTMDVHDLNDDCDVVMNSNRGFDLNSLFDGGSGDGEDVGENVIETVENGDAQPTEEIVGGDGGLETNVEDVEDEELPDVEEVLDESEKLRRNIVYKNAVNLFEHDVGLVSDIKPPEVGMSFECASEFAAFVLTYSYKMGFEVYTRSSDKVLQFVGTKQKRGDADFFKFRRIRFICKKGGKPEGPGSNRCDCQFVVDGRIRKGKTCFEITIAKLDHTNHEPRPDDRGRMVSYRVMTDYFKRRMLLNDSAGISIVNNYQSLVMECGGHENLTFSKSDARNVINIERRRARLGGDFAAMLEYFEKLKREDPNFFYAYQEDEEGRVANIFWADARQRSMFKSFFDAISFDTTFMTNRYRFSFAPFIGINHHGQSVVLGAAIIKREDAESFEWVFKKWVECMGKPPSLIITDQCKAIASGIRTVFGEGFPHRLCLWHIMQNARKNLGMYSKWSEIEAQLSSIVYESITEDEFVEHWDAMVGAFNLGGSRWINDSFEIRHKWVPAYWRGTFCAGMSSTQRSEQSNRFFKGHFTTETGLIQMVEQYESALKAKVEEENALNFKSVDAPVKGFGELPIENVFQRLYTNRIFKEFKGEILGMIRVSTSVRVRVGTFVTFTAEEYVNNPVWRRGLKKYEVKVDSTALELSCSCKLFEFKGLLCRHIMRCMVAENMHQVPDKYVLDRWKKGLVRGYEHLRVGYYDPQHCLRVRRDLNIQMNNDFVRKMAMYSDSAYAIYDKGVSVLKKELQDHIGIDTVRSLGTGAESLKVWGRRRVDRLENNQRHFAKKRPLQSDLQTTKDPVDKRGTGRAKKIKQKTFKKRRDVDCSPYSTPAKSRLGPGLSLGTPGTSVGSRRVTPAKRTRAHKLLLVDEGDDFDVRGPRRL